MTTTIHPSLLLTMDMDTSVYSEDLAAELKRSYTSLAPTTVEHHDTGEFGAENIIRLSVKTQRALWNSSEEDASDLWETSLKKWFSNKFERISSTISACNRIREENGESILQFSWVEVVLDGTVTISVLLEPDSSIPTDASEVLAQARTLFNPATFTEGEVSQIRIPARQAIIEARLATDEEELENQVGEKVDSAVPAEIDRSLWDITFSDGRVHQFNVETGSMLP